MQDPLAFDDNLSEKVATYLARLSFWGSKIEIARRWQNENLVASDVECSFRLEDDFDQSLFYLPSAINYLQHALRTEIASRAVASFLGCWHENLAACGMQQVIADRLSSLLTHWLRTFPAQEGSIEFRSQDCLIDTFAPCISIHFLNELVEKKVFGRGDPNKGLADMLINRIFHQSSSETISANFLAFLLKARTATEDWKIYQHPTVRDAAFNIESFRFHTRIAKTLLQQKCSDDYLN